MTTSIKASLTHVNDTTASGPNDAESPTREDDGPEDPSSIAVPVRKDEGVAAFNKLVPKANKSETEGNSSNARNKPSKFSKNMSKVVRA